MTGKGVFAANPMKGVGVVAALVVSQLAAAGTPVSHWALDDGSGAIAADSGTPGGHAGTVTGATWLDSGTAVTPISGTGALLFDGDDNAVDTGATASDLGIDGDASRTISAWVHCTDFNRGGVFSVGNQSEAELLCLRTSAWNEMGTHFWRLETCNGSETFLVPFSKDRWVHFVVTHEAGVGTKVYADAQLLVDWTKTLATSATIGTFQIGVFHDTNGSDYFEGAIDDVRVYGAALTPAEVNTLYNGVHPTTAPTALSASLPLGRETYLGGTAEFRAPAHGTAPLTFQWQVDSGGGFVDVTTGTGEDTALYTTDALALGDDGNQYQCVITNAVSSITSVAATVTVADATLLGHWSFNDASDVGRDYSGNGKHGAVNGAPTAVAGRVGNGLSLDGVDDWIEIGAVDLSAGTAARTVCGWVRTTGTRVDWMSIFGFQQSTDANTTFGLGISEGWEGHPYHVHWYGGDLNITGGDSEWHHFALVYDEMAITVYEDGAHKWTNDAAGAGRTYLDTNDYVSIGREEGGSLYFPGDVDEVRIYEGVLSPEQVRHVMTAEKHWLGGTGNFSDAANWACIPGGTPGAAVPSGGDTAVFGGENGGGICTADAAIDIAGLTVANVGLVAECYNGIAFDTHMGTYRDRTIDFAVGDAIGQTRCGGGDTFSVRWTGQVKADYTETYTFYVDCDDGARIWVDSMGSPLAEDWTNHAAVEISGTVALTAGSWHDIVVEWYESTGDSLVHLSFSSPSQAKTIVPAASLRTGPEITLTQGASTVAVGALGVELDGGTITGGTVDMDIDGPVTMMRGNFVATSGATNLSGDMSISDEATFDHNGGTFSVDGACAITVGAAGLPLDDLTIAATGDFTAPSGVLSIEGDFANNGAFTGNAGTVVLAGGDSELLGTQSTTFDGLTVGDSVGDVGRVGVDATVNGSLTLNAGSTLQLGSAASLTLGTASEFTTSGTASWTAGEYATVTGDTVSDPVMLDLAGSVTAQWVLFDQTPATGVVLSGGPGATAFEHVRFRINEGGPDSTHLMITGTGWDGATLTGFSFDGTDADDPTYAVAITSGGSVTLTEYDEAVGMVFGDHFDRDEDGNPDADGVGIIDWTGGATGPVPSTFTLIGPGGGTHVAVRPDMQWNSTAYAEYYIVHVYDGDPIGAGTEVFTTTVTDATNYQILMGDLGYDTDYWWLVTAHSGDQTTDSDTLQFTSNSDTDRPEVVSTSPVYGEDGVALGRAVTVAFTEAMGTASVTAAFSITPNVTGNFTWSPDDRTMTFTPVLGFEYGTTYVVTIDAAAADQAPVPNTLAAPYSFTFEAQALLVGIAPLGAKPCGGLGVSTPGASLSWMIALLLAGLVTSKRRRHA